MLDNSTELRIPKIQKLLAGNFKTLRQNRIKEELTFGRKSSVKARNVFKK